MVGALGIDVGAALGIDVGTPLGIDVGTALGIDVGTALGIDVGIALGIDVGIAVGLDVGTALGIDVGRAVGLGVGLTVCVNCILFELMSADFITFIVTLCLLIYCLLSSFDFWQSIFDSTVPTSWPFLALLLAPPLLFLLSLSMSSLLISLIRL